MRQPNPYALQVDVEEGDGQELQNDRHRHRRRCPSYPSAILARCTPSNPKRWHSLLVVTVLMTTIGVGVVSSQLLIRGTSEFYGSEVNDLAWWLCWMDYPSSVLGTGILFCGRPHLPAKARAILYAKGVAAVTVSTTLRILGIVAASTYGCHPSWSSDECRVLVFVAFLNGTIATMVGIVAVVAFVLVLVTRSCEHSYETA